MSNPLDIIKEADAQLFARINDAKELAFQEGEIAMKNKFLIAMAIDVAKNSESGIKSLAAQALANGASEREILETLRIASYICGVGSMYTAAQALSDIL